MQQNIKKTNKRKETSFFSQPETHYILIAHNIISKIFVKEINKSINFEKNITKL